MPNNINKEINKSLKKLCVTENVFYLYNFQVYHDDTDFTGIMYHANYLKYFERARTDAMHHCGLMHGKLKSEHNLMFVVHKLNIEYKSPCYLEDHVEIVTKIPNVKGAVIFFEQTMNSQYANGRFFARIELEVVCVNNKGVPIPIPKFIRDRIYK